MGRDGSLQEIDAVTAFWFAWFDFFPATSIYGLEKLVPQPSAPDDLTVPVAASLGAGALGVGALFLWRRRKRWAASPTETGPDPREEKK